MKWCEVSKEIMQHKNLWIFLVRSVSFIELSIPNANDDVGIIILIRFKG